MTPSPLVNLLAEIEDVLRSMPPTRSFGNDSPEVLAWLGRASAAVHAWNSPKALVQFDAYVAKLGSSILHEYTPAMRGVVITLNQARYDLRTRTIGPLSVSLNTGAVFDYFDEVRKAVETARQDVLFVDPYLDAEFVSRYLPHVDTGVSVRLLAREKLGSLLPAVQLMRSQSSLAIEVRSASGFHDRYVIIDKAACYQSGASFKDGAKNAPTTLTQIADAFPAVHATYETLWASAKPQP